MFNSKDWNHDRNSEQWKEIKNVNAIHDLSVKIKKGDFVFVIGGSGSGKRICRFAS